MKIKQSLLFCSSLTLALAMVTPVQAGWLDFLTGSSEEAAEKVQQGAETVNKVNQAVQTGAETAQSLPTAQQGLTGVLMQQLGVSETQATGGAGALFQVAKQRMTENAFNQLSQAVPGMDGLLAAAPKQSGTVGGLAEGLLGKDSAVSQTASLISAFQQLDMSQGMVSQFTPIVVDYVKQQGGPQLANLLQLALTGS
ncbi:DUF2780 domain-containing protein [Methylomarinum sp. Ch1-1]|uniref:DUF2780 domain-containing protein n=1 Tax=Methylomarinum roseum TaxID=3067653 RepID=A0AAU7NYJ9_9GAMM|nr:DUF2780 domain-containing protein [Methylomarinum sp. Ch1-1]MDP4521835.1 DUF2780 domain-containing protein [Methylomarinum sp. Ch1-1]